MSGRSLKRILETPLNVFIGCLAIVLMLTAVGQAQASWKLVWEDEFNGTELDTTKWTAVTDCGDHRNTEQQCYMASAVSVGNGMLTITGTDQAQNGYSYTSGAIKTGNWSSPSNSKFTQAYGRFEFRAQLPAGGQGIWPALWLYPPRQWPPEIDLVETVNTMSTVYMTYHWGTESTHQQDGSSTTIANPSDWHIYAVEWETSEIRWYIDDVLKKTHTGTDVTDIPMQLYINLALGGIWPGPVGSSTVFPQFLHVDYVRVYSDSTMVGLATAPSFSVESFAAYPNPFNPDVTLRFVLGKQSAVTINVFDVRGKRVATLLKETCPAGLQTRVWNGRNYLGRLLPSGVYLIHFSTPATNEIRRVLFLK